MRVFEQKLKAQMDEKETARLEAVNQVDLMKNEM
jgi:hypothetical protein